MVAAQLVILPAVIPDITGGRVELVVVVKVLSPDTARLPSLSALFVRK